jgi:hypothetical protein
VSVATMDGCRRCLPAVAEGLRSSVVVGAPSPTPAVAIGPPIRRLRTRSHTAYAGLRFPVPVPVSYQTPAAWIHYYIAASWSWVASHHAQRLAVRRACDAHVVGSARGCRSRRRSPSDLLAAAQNRQPRPRAPNERTQAVSPCRWDLGHKSVMLKRVFSPSLDERGSSRLVVVVLLPAFASVAEVALNVPRRTGRPLNLERWAESGRVVPHKIPRIDIACWVDE